MKNIIIFIIYFIFSCTGMVLVKFGGQSESKVIFNLPILNLTMSTITFIGFLFYGLSFVLYSYLLSKYELSFLNPVTIGITAIIILFCSIIIFNETITLSKILGLVLIIFGVLIINIFK